MESGSNPPAGKPDDRIPRGAIVVVAIGLLATLAAALLTTGKGSGEAAHLEFVQQASVPDSKPVAIPGSEEAKMRLVEGKIQETGTNVEGYSLFRVKNTLIIDAGAPVGAGRIVCATHAPSAEIAHSHGELRTTYPRSSENGIWGQSIPETLLVKFASHGYEYAVLEVEDLKQPRWSSIQGVKLEWPKFEEGTEHIKYFLPEGKPDVPIELPFYTIWKTQKAPAAEVSCEVQVAAGKATVKTAGALRHISPPIDEEAEEENQEQREEAEEAAEEDEEGAEGE
jgi:hypothetical protein